MGRNAHKAIPLEIRWRLPEALPAAGEVVEIGYIRWLDEHSRLTVGRVRVPVERPHQFMLGATIHAEAEGWQVFLNEQGQHEEPLSFLDACYAGWATFTDAVPTLAKVLTRTLATKARYDGWDADEMEVHLLEEDHDTIDTDTAEPATAGSGG
jgi:hypothetical protein